MTTVAYKDGILAADGRVTAHDDLVSTDEDEKVFKLEDGSLFSAAGDVEDCEDLLEALRNGGDTPELDDIEALWIKPDGSVYRFERKRWSKQRGKYFALGSGAGYALAAMDAGADALKAVKIAIKRDPRSGGEVQYVELDRP